MFRKSILGMMLLLGAAVAAPASAVVINFDSLANGVSVTNQYPEATFSSTAGFTNWTTAQSLGSSLPNFICTGPSGGGIDCVHNTIVTFAAPVDGLTFLGVGIDNSGTVALVDVYVNNVLSATANVVGNATALTPDLVDLSAFSGVTKIEIRSITDAAGIGWDDFTFTQTRPAPEPGTLALLGLGLAGLAATRRRKQ